MAITLGSDDPGTAIWNVTPDSGETVNTSRSVLAADVDIGGPIMAMLIRDSENSCLQACQRILGRSGPRVLANHPLPRLATEPRPFLLVVPQAADRLDPGADRVNHSQRRVALQPVTRHRGTDDGFRHTGGFKQLVFD